jgi:hypothetical protein
MPSKSKQPQIPLPKSWGAHVKTAILHVVALAQYALTYSRSWAADKASWHFGTEGVVTEARSHRLSAKQ